MPRRRQREPPRRRQFDIIKDTGNEHGHPGADPLLERPQRLARIGRFDDHEVRGAKAERFETIEIGNAVFVAQAT